MTDLSGLADRVAAAAKILGAAASSEQPLGPMATYRVGGAARLFVEVETPATLDLIAEAVMASGLPTLVVGRGSNLLVADRGFDGIALRLGSGLGTIDIDADARIVRPGGSALLPVVARQSTAAGLTGFEWAFGVPGAIGGATRMNAGGHGSDMSESLETATIFDLTSGETTIRNRSDLAFGYRRSAIAAHHVVTEIALKLEPGDPAAGKATIDEIVRWRRANQPGGPNAGSVFTNPAGDSAGRLIDEAGAKGHRLGTAAVSEKHANFIQADPGGRADDVFALMIELADLIEARAGFRLEAETRLVGFTDSELARLHQGQSADAT